jgi:hypothetical protein
VHKQKEKNFTELLKPPPLHQKLADSRKTQSAEKNLDLIGVEMWECGVFLGL